MQLRFAGVVVAAVFGLLGGAVPASPHHSPTMSEKPSLYVPALLRMA